jgi:hypothetical protein
MYYYMYYYYYYYYYYYNTIAIFNTELSQTQEFAS